MGWRRSHVVARPFCPDLFCGVCGDGVAALASVDHRDDAGKEAGRVYLSVANSKDPGAPSPMRRLGPQDQVRGALMRALQILPKSRPLLSIVPLFEKHAPNVTLPWRLGRTIRRGAAADGASRRNRIVDLSPFHGRGVSPYDRRGHKKSALNLLCETAAKELAKPNNKTHAGTSEPLPRMSSQPCLLQTSSR